MEKRLNARIFGRVQMVMFRDFTARAARRLGLSGYVRNEKDGSVFVCAEGEEEQLNELLRLVSRGPLLAHVERVDASWDVTTGEWVEFSILYDK